VHNNDEKAVDKDKKPINNDEIVIEKLKESLDFLDRSVEVKKPDLMQLVQMVNEIEGKKKSSNNWQFIIFLATAFFIISLETYSFYRSIVFFVAVQATALICVVPAVVSWVRRRNRQVLDK